MNTSVTWNGRNEFSGTNYRNDAVVIIDYADSLKGEVSRGTTPKQLFLQSIAGCTGLDVINILTKMRSVMPETFTMDVDGVTAETEPAVFKYILLTYHFSGACEQKSVLKAVKLSQEKYCSISIMVKQICDFEYSVILNGAEIYREKNNLQ